MARWPASRCPRGSSSTGSCGRPARAGVRWWRSRQLRPSSRFLIGGGAGWFARGASAASPAGFDTLTADALDAYKLYVVEVRHPVEVPGSERAHMTQWLSKRLGSTLHIPDLESIGLKLVGGRLLPGPTGAAAFYMYEGASGERFTIYCAKATSPETALALQEWRSARPPSIGWTARSPMW